MPRKNTKRSDWIWVFLTQKERAKQGERTTFTFNGREYSDEEIRKEIARKGIDTDLFFIKEMPEVPEGWTATTSLAEPYSDTFSPGASLSSPRDFRGWTDKADIEEWKEEHWAAQIIDIMEVTRSNSVNPRCPEGSTPLDWAVDPRVRKHLFSFGGRTTRIGSDGKRVLCNRQETLDQLIDEGYRHSVPSKDHRARDRAPERKPLPYAAYYLWGSGTLSEKDFFKDEVNSASAFMAQMQIAPREPRLPDTLNDKGRASDISNCPSSWQKPTQALILEDLEESSFPSSSKNTGGSADLSCSPMSWENTTEAPTPEDLKGSPFPMSRYLGSSAGSAAISIRGSSYRSSYQNSSLRQTSLMRTAMLTKGSHREQKLRKEDWEHHESWATPRLPTPKW